MKTIYLILAILIVSCQQEIIEPTICNGIKYDHYAPQRIHLLIDSKEPELTFVWRGPDNLPTHSITVAYPYYNELWLVLCFGHTLTINNQCEFNGQ